MLPFDERQLVGKLRIELILAFGLALKLHRPLDQFQLLFFALGNVHDRADDEPPAFVAQKHARGDRAIEQRAIFATEAQLDGLRTRRLAVPGQSSENSACARSTSSVASTQQVAADQLFRTKAGLLAKCAI